MAAPPPLPKPGGLGGLGAPGGLGVGKIDPRVAAFENEILRLLNQARKQAGVASLAPDERLRLFGRAESELAVRTSFDLKGTDERLKQQGLAAAAHRFQFAYGTEARAVAADLLGRPDLKAAVLSDYERAGIGAFWVPADKPFFQLLVVLVRDPDPMAGKPGLSPAETDPVVNAAEPRIRTCYNAALGKDPNLHGDLLFQVVIGGTGAVESARLLKSLAAEGFDDCALTVIRALVFPAPYKGKPVTLTQPMRFTPPQGDKRIGRLSPAQIAAGFGLAQADFRACYEARAAEKPTLGGIIALAVTVVPDGAVANASIVQDEPGDAGLLDCVVKRVMQLRFAKPEFDAPVELTYRVTFSPK